MKTLAIKEYLMKYKVFGILYNHFDLKKWKLLQKYHHSNCSVTFSLSSTPPNVSYNFKDFQEPLLALNEHT